MLLTNLPYHNTEIDLLVILWKVQYFAHTPQFAFQNVGSQLGIVSLCIPPISTAPVEHRHQVVLSGPQLQDLVLLPQTVPPAGPPVHVVPHTFQASPQECHPLLSWSVSYKNMSNSLCDGDVQQTSLFAYFFTQSFEELAQSIHNH